MRQYLTAHTATNNDYPAFINITRVDHGFVEITMREQGKNGKEGQCIMITLSPTDFNALIGELLLKNG